MAYKPRGIPGTEGEHYTSHSHLEQHSEGYQHGGHKKKEDDVNEEYRQKLYNAGKEKEDILSKDYISSKNEEIKKEEDAKEPAESHLDEKKEKYKKDDDTDEELQRPSGEIHQGVSQEKREQARKKSKSTIEDAIEKAIKGEKETIILN